MFYGADSSKELTLDEASEIIEKFGPENPEKQKNISSAFNQIYEAQGQQKLL